VSLKSINELIILENGKRILDNIRVNMSELSDDFREAGKKDELVLATKISKDIVDCETGERGFLLAGKDSFLEPYYRGQVNISKHAKELEAMLIGEEENLKRLASIKSLHERWLNEAARPEINARIEYEIKGERYISEWITKNTRSGKLVDYEMFIYDVSGKPLDLKKSEVPAHNEAIIGLKYDQFVKSIILSQGQFAKFLQASKDERGQLLENLTGSSIYRKIGIATFDKHREIKNAVMMEKDRLENITCLSEEARKELKAEILNAKDQKITTEKLLIKLNQQQKAKSDIRKNKANIDTVSTEQKKVQSEEGVFESQKNKLDIYDKLSPLRGEMTRYQDASKSANRLTSQIIVINQQLSTAREEYDLTIADM
jgi:DNA repair exonuclease SbcCD ATPase subunit